jgi:predicted nucleic acid-binding Zn ribbon protein
MNRRGLRSFAPALEDVARRAAPTTTLGRVQACWAQAVGVGVAAESEPSAERDGVLTVVCTSSVWAQELELLSADLLDRLNGALGAGEEPIVRRLRFVAGLRRDAS